MTDPNTTVSVHVVNCPECIRLFVGWQRAAGTALIFNGAHEIHHVEVSDSAAYQKAAGAHKTHAAGCEIYQGYLRSVRE